MKKIVIAVSLIAALIMLSTAPAAEAGTAFTQNNSKSFYCKTGFMYYLFGFTIGADATPCAAPGKLEWRNTWYSIGWMQTICWSTMDKCKSNGGSGSTYDQGIPSVWDVTGTWLPSYNYTATISDDGRASYKQTW